MGARAAQEVKQRLIAQMAEARQAMALHAGRASVELAPAAIFQRSFQRHRAAWIAVAVVAGAAAIRLLLPSRAGKNRRDKNSKTATKGTISGLLSGVFSAVARKALFSYAQKQVQHFVESQLSPSVSQDREPHSPPPSSSSPHV